MFKLFTEVCLYVVHSLCLSFRFAYVRTNEQTHTLSVLTEAEKKALREEC